MVYSGAYAYMLSRKKGYYQSIVEKYKNQQSPYTAEIDKVNNAD
jgi:hypothetical protein